MKGFLNMEDKLICAFCGAEVDSDEAEFLDGECMCSDCYEDRTVDCACCGERIWRDDNEGDDRIYLCSHCRDYHYTTCEDCGRLINIDDAFYLEDDSDVPYCSECFSRKSESKHIHDYNYKPEPIFYGKGKRYFGTEIEIDGAGEYDDNAEILEKLANQNGNYIYIKHDGSLNDGMELVSHPMTLDFHKNSMPWQEVMKKAVSMGYRSHKTTTCGLHVHVNRSSFGNNPCEQDDHISRVLFFVERFWQELLTFSRRTEYQIKRWAARYGMKEDPKAVMNYAKSSYSGRYMCVNLTNYHTIEFRIFRGTLRYNTLIATLQLVNKVCDVAVSMSDEDLTSLSWPEFVAMIEEPELISYLKERRLYVNEPVEVMEEV